jgi:ParB family transcriptional regulator, chromosome partitioning protein
MKNKKITLMADREYRLIPVESIVVLNSRNRNQQKFAENVRSIDEVGLRKPIVVNGRGFDRTGKYELVCGEGRYLAHKKLDRAEIPAEVIDCDRKTALLFSLVENIARVPPGTMWFAFEMKRMHDAGLNFTEISRYVGKTATYVSSYIQLVKNGEIRLIEGVEQGLFSISFAVQVAQSDDSTIQNVLMDAFDDGMVNCNTVRRVRKLLELRMSRGKNSDQRLQRSEGYTLKELKHEIVKSTKEKEDFVRETQQKENRLMTLLLGISTLMKDPRGMEMLSSLNLSEPPTLQRDYGITLLTSGEAVS